MNKTLENYLRCFVGERPKDWALWISIAEWWYNITTQSSTGLTPFEALYGYPSLRLLSYSPRASSVEAVDTTLRSHKQVKHLLKSNLHKRQNAKLSPRFYGPLRVEERIKSVAYQLKLFETSLIHPVFYVSLLNKKLGQSVSPLQQLPSIDSNGILKPEPEEILDRRLRQVHHRPLT
ncbi:hypothetical protein F2P56_018438 [Juglans regia]|uniref:Tf2-1-like SH3-like domain-containing protein n=1 Tax=Juglans regia TaxID=51240 RepID=A0A833UUR2_JUGRE|nr:hypothetical protein F2P56_018438 [Juglans regia]